MLKTTHAEYLASKTKELKVKLITTHKRCVELENELDQVSRYILGYRVAQYTKFQKEQLEQLDSLPDCVTQIQKSETKLYILKIEQQLKGLRTELSRFSDHLEGLKRRLLQREGTADVSQIDARLLKISDCLSAPPVNTDHIYASLLDDQNSLLEEFYKARTPSDGDDKRAQTIKKIFLRNDYYMTLKRQEYSSKVWSLMETRQKRGLSDLEMEQSEENIKRLKKCIDLYPPLRTNPAYRGVTSVSFNT